MKPSHLVLASFVFMLASSVPGYALEAYLRRRRLGGLLALEWPSAAGFNAIVQGWRNAELPIVRVVVGGYLADGLLIASYGFFFYITLRWLAAHAILPPAIAFVPIVAATADLVEDAMDIWMIARGATSPRMIIAGAATCIKFLGVGIAATAVFVGLWRW